MNCSKGETTCRVEGHTGNCSQGETACTVGGAPRELFSWRDSMHGRRGTQGTVLMERQQRGMRGTLGTVLMERQHAR